ncbi:hypothetical protein PR048_001438 [Dryococelus australis]|uniref:Reverse transcriptase domain-containing protein n=1 Tax=Dryococelus australis TaxID=614101 RepID=A0ABQ9IHG6_9NEOP|nr:hypothetical protein PR048_001438 [Dryococelus australis]
MGFRTNHSPIYVLTRVTKYAVQSFKRREKADIVFIDIEKAFDKVHHHHLTCKLIEAGIPDIYWRIIKDSLEKPKFLCHIEWEKVNYNEDRGRSATRISHYTPQISQKQIQQTSHYMLMTQQSMLKTKKLFYAKAKLQQYVNKLEAYWEKWDITVNPTKSAAIIFHRGRDNNIMLHHNNEEIPIKKTIKYLGVNLNEKLTWQTHITNVANAERGKLLQEYPLLKWNKMPIKTKIMLYKETIRAALLYGSEVWGTAAKIHQEKLQLTEN